MAARVGDAAALRRALDKAALVVAAGEVGEGLEAVRCAVAAEANEARETPLLATVEKGRLEVVVELLRHLDAQGVAAKAAGAAPLVTAAFLLLPLRLLSLVFSLRLPTFPPVSPARRSVAALLTVAALLGVTCATPEAGSIFAPDGEALRSEISELRLKLARLGRFHDQTSNRGA